MFQFVLIYYTQNYPAGAFLGLTKEVTLAADSSEGLDNSRQSIDAEGDIQVTESDRNEVIADRDQLISDLQAEAKVEPGIPG